MTLSSKQPLTNSINNQYRVISRCSSSEDGNNSEIQDLSQCEHCQKCRKADKSILRKVRHHQQQQHQNHKINKNFKKFFPTIFLLAIYAAAFVPGSFVDGLALNVENSNPESLLQQIYFRNSTKVREQQKRPSPAVIENSNLEIEPKHSNVSNNKIEGKGDDASKNSTVVSSNVVNINGDAKGKNKTHETTEDPKNCDEHEQNQEDETSAYGHGVEEVLKQIFGANDDDETNADDDDENEDISQRNNTGVSVVQLARRIRSAPPEKDSRRGPLQVDDSQTQEEDDDEVHRKIGPQQQHPNRKRVQPNRRKQQNHGSSNGGNSGSVDKKADHLAKYNVYMDAVFSRMNTLIKKKRMDPLRVNLYAGPSKGGNGGNKNPNKNNNKVKKGNKGKKTSRMEDDSDQSGDSAPHADDDDSNDDDDYEDYDSSSDDDEQRALRDRSPVHNVHLDSSVFGRNIRSLLANISQFSDAVLSDPASERVDISEDKASESASVEQGRGNESNPNANKNNKGNTPGAKKPKQHRNGTAGNKNSTTGGNKNNKNKHKKKKGPHGPRPTRGILHGLSTLRRDGNVQVVKDGAKARLVRAKFLLGPVALEILPKKGKPNKARDAENPDENPPDNSSGGSAGAAPAATATAPQLKGILEIRLTPNRPTRIRRLRVFPPGNVQVQGEKSPSSNNGGGYRKVTPQATARLRQTALQVVRQVDHKLKNNHNKKNLKHKEQNGQE